MTYNELYRAAKSRLQLSGIDDPQFEAHCMFSELLSMDRLRLVSDGDKTVPDHEVNTLLYAAEKRTSGYPLQYILGKWSFMGRDYYVGEGVLIPRDDTEVAVMTCYEAVKALPSARIIDLCSGSGIIAITLSWLLEGADITAVELSDTAFSFLERNITLNGCKNVRPVKGDIFSYYNNIDDLSLDAVISNPPYIRRDVIPALQREVQYEPMKALDGGTDGLDFYRCIAKFWMPKLRAGGTVTLEIGEEQAKDVISLLEANGIGSIMVVKDIQGLDRVIFGTKNKV